MEIELSEVLAKRHLERQEARVKLDAAEVKNVSLREPEALPDETKPQTYFGMSPEPVVSPDRLKHYWSILGDCIDYRKEFIFRCENVDEADELKKLTYTLVFQYSDRWEVSLNDLVVKANPPSSNSVPNTN
tara:strand:+ start:24 stop:416 length:393 start_codon:yes stop_codon:yes gene_type:complete